MKNVAMVCFVFLLSACAGSKLPTRSLPSRTLDGAILYLEKGDIEGAVEYLEESRRITPSPYAAFLLGDIFDTMGNPTLALPHYLSVIESVHKDGGAHLEATAAAMAIVAIRNRVSGFQRSLDEAFSRMGDSKGLLPQEAWFQLNNLRLGLARRNPDETAPKKALSRMGCLTRWDVVGPVGPFKWQRFDSAEPPAPGRNRPVSMELGPGRGTSPFREVRSHTCFMALQNPAMAIPGLTWARTAISLDTAKEVYFRVQTSQGMKVFAGGEEIYKKDPRQIWPSRVEWFVAPLPAGATEIAVAVVASQLPPSFSLVAVDSAGRPADSDTGGSPLPLGVPADDSNLLPVRIPPDPVGRYAALKMALFWDDIESATRLIESFRIGNAVLSPAISAVYAEAMQSDLSLPGDVAYEQARAIEVRALESEPRLWQIRMNLSDRAFSDGLTKKAVSLLREGIDLSPKEPELVRRLLGLFSAEGWVGETHRTLDTLSDLMPNACNTLEWHLTIARRTQKFEKAREWATKLKQCDASSSALAEEWLRAQNWPDALAERQRLASRDLFRASPHIETIRAALAGGMEEEAISTTLTTLAPFLGDPAIRFLLVDLLAASGDTDQAIRTLHQGAAMSHSPGLSYLNAESSLRETPLLHALRVDGLEIIDEYNALDPNYDTASVFVLDRAVHIIGGYGEMTTIVHTISHLQTDEAIEAQGELHLPDGALLLRARTIKKDGRILTPERIPRKTTFSFPALEAGDFVESEYVFQLQPNRIYPGGFDTERFYFQDFDTAFHRSEMILSAPKETRIQLDPRGPCPRPIHRVEGDRAYYSWRVSGMLPSPSEPLSPAATEYLPSIRASANVKWPNVMSRMSDLLADANRPSRHIRSALKDVVGDRPQKEHLGAIYAWVLNHIEPGDDLFEQASHIVARKSGDRARAFHALARAAGFAPRLALVKPSGRDERAQLAHDYANFDVRLVEIPGKGWLEFQQTSTPFGFLSPRLRYRPVRYLDDGSVGKTDGGGIPFDSQDINVELEVVAQTSVEGVVTETLMGVLANNWRAEFTSQPRGEWNKRFEQQYLSSVIPGAELRRLVVKNLRSPGLPLILKYGFFLEKFARPQAGSLTARIPYPISLLKQIGGLPRRTTPLVLSSWIQKNVHVSVYSRDSARIKFVHAGDDFVQSPFGTVKRWHKSEAGTLHIGYETTLRVNRVPPNGYTAFLSFATEVDRISEMEIQWAP